MLPEIVMMKSCFKLKIKTKSNGSKQIKFPKIEY
jgi:hypothetical protein